MIFKRVSQKVDLFVIGEAMHHTIREITELLGNYYITKQDKKDGYTYISKVWHYKEGIFVTKDSRDLRCGEDSR